MSCLSSAEYRAHGNAYIDTLTHRQVSRLGFELTGASQLATKKELKELILSFDTFTIADAIQLAEAEDLARERRRLGEMITKYQNATPEAKRERAAIVISNAIPILTDDETWQVTDLIVQLQAKYAK